MTEFEAILRRHAASYPNMEPRDAVKLCYQAEYGGEHLLSTETDSLSRLQEEWDTAPASGPLTEPAGETVLRLHLGPARETGLPAELVNRLFVLSASMRQGSQVGLEERLTCLRACADSFSFSEGELEKFLSTYRNAGYPALHHSDRYRAAYRPAYRLVAGAYGPLLPVLEQIEALRRTRERVVVAIDGNCGGGKTTLANLLAPLYYAPIIQMDDFFLPPELWSEERRRRANIHYERFGSEVLVPLSEGVPFDYRQYSCRLGRYDGTAHVEPAPVTVVEGTYCCHPEMGHSYDFRIFVETGQAEQELRIRRRDGEDGWQRFRRLWIPLENQYFTENKIREHSDLVIRT